MSSEQGDSMPEWFKPHAENIYLTLRVMAGAHKHALELHHSQVELDASRWRRLFESLEGPAPNLESLKAELEFQRDSSKKLADQTKNCVMDAVKALDRMDMAIERLGIKVPPEFLG